MAIGSRMRQEDAFSLETGGNHQVLWYRTDAGRTRAIAEFMRSGIKNGDLLVIVLPLRELQSTEKDLVIVKVPVQRLMREGRLLLFASEELLPGNESDCSKIKSAIAAVHEKAKAEGRNLCLIGRVAPVLFERGDIKGALAVEFAADSSLGQARLLCLYDARQRGKLSAESSDKIDELHTISYDETPSGGVRIKNKRQKRPANIRRKSSGG